MQDASQILTKSLYPNPVTFEQCEFDRGGSLIRGFFFRSKYTVGPQYLRVPHPWIEPAIACTLCCPLLVDSMDADPRIRRANLGTWASIWYLLRILEPVPHGYQGTTIFYISSRKFGYMFSDIITVLKIKRRNDREAEQYKSITPNAKFNIVITINWKAQ